MSYIPGLSVISTDDTEESGIPVPAFSGTGFIPASRVFGNCQPVSDFEQLGILHDGEFAKIYKCKDKRTDELFALKKIKIPSLENGIPATIIREMKMFKQLKHDNIVTYLRAVVGRSLESNYMLLEYCEYSLKDLMENNDAIYGEEIVKYIMKQLFEGLAFIHDAMVLHRNISCSNILFDDKGVLKITGLRTCRVHSKGDMTPRVTELIYRAPELLFGTKKYGPSVDMWSAGCIFARLLLKKPLFTGKSELEVLSSIFDVLGSPSEAVWPGFTELSLLRPSSLIENFRSYSTISKIFWNVPASSTVLINDLLLYYPMVRLSAKDSLTAEYFKDIPDTCSPENFVKILLFQRPMEIDR